LLNQDSIAFSLDGGITYLPALNDTLEFVSYTGLNAGTYNLHARFENETCPTDLNTEIIITGEADTDLDGVCDIEDNCAGFDDNLDDDEDNIPDACDLCTNYWEDLSLPNLNVDQSAKIQVTTNGIINNGNHVILQAGETIYLSTGFSVEPGAEFEAHIELCSD